ncbi:hypothetical protein CRM22_010808 [Opisthorchis felineus]|uniref:V-type proton ATPase subunit n=1 Tax=Opisthorchis felineus TaxID=147828 RepID=A0A4S2KL72_OPIFE|nr:hypothetical protein CRM22_010808 [Opisthorchis felineus]
MDIDRGFYIPLAVLTGFWLLVAVIGPLFVPKGPNRTLIVLSLVLTAVCAYIFWLGMFLSQYNPLFGPNLSRESLFVIKSYWRSKGFQ